MNTTNPDNASFKQNESSAPPSADVSAGDKEAASIADFERRVASLSEDSGKKEPATDDVRV